MLKEAPHVLLLVVSLTTITSIVALAREPLANLIRRNQLGYFTKSLNN